MGIIGSAILMVSGFIAFSRESVLEAQLALGGLTWADTGFDPSILMIRAILTVLVAVIGLFGAILALKSKKLGAFLLLILGLVAIIGSLVPIAYILTTIEITLIAPILYLESILMIVGGILAIALKN